MKQISLFDTAVVVTNKKGFQFKILKKLFANVVGQNGDMTYPPPHTINEYPNTIRVNDDFRKYFYLTYKNEKASLLRSHYCSSQLYAK